MYQHSYRDLEGWLAKHRTREEVEWALMQSKACIRSLSKDNGLEDPEELSLWRARLTLLKPKALLLGIPLGE